ncbi:hypothetical protein P7C70_g7522, partial [Phenoliferia sp. Uapishka_3]
MANPSRPTHFQNATYPPDTIFDSLDGHETPNPRTSSAAPSSSRKLPLDGNSPQPYAGTMMKKWYEDHRADPYPAKFEKQRWVYELGLSINQIENFFINARRRDPLRKRMQSEPPIPSPAVRPSPTSPEYPREYSDPWIPPQYAISTSDSTSDFVAEWSSPTSPSSPLEQPNTSSVSQGSGYFPQDESGIPSFLSAPTERRQGHLYAQAASSSAAANLPRASHLSVSGLQSHFASPYDHGNHITFPASNATDLRYPNHSSPSPRLGTTIPSHAAARSFYPSSEQPNAGRSAQSQYIYSRQPTSSSYHQQPSRLASLDPSHSGHDDDTPSPSHFSRIRPRTD